MLATTLPAFKPLQTPALARTLTPGRVLPLAVIAAAHVLLVWALLQRDSITRVLQQVRPLMVALVADTVVLPPAPKLARPPARALPPAAAPLPPPEIAVASAAPAPVAVSPQAPLAQAAALARPAELTPRTPALAPAPVAAPAPAAPRQLAAGAIRYRVPPAIELPMASRRLGEQGTVLLQVLVDAQGLPRQISVHRSSGHARLDEQAVAAMRQARFQPVNEGGSAIEWLVIAPLLYELD